MQQQQQHHQQQHYLHPGLPMTHRHSHHVMMHPSHFPPITCELQTAGCPQLITEQSNDCKPSPDQQPQVKSAAKTRRERENHEFVELSRLLPLPPAITSQLDKASIIRLTTSYLKMTAILPERFGKGRCYVSPSAFETGVIGRELSSHLLQTLDGFMFVIGGNGKLLYISETASTHLGLSQVELIGNSILEYVHPGDHDDFRLHLMPNLHHRYTNSTNIEYEQPRSFFIRMKCILAKRNAGLTINGYKVVRCSGYLKIAQCNGRMQGAGLVALAQAIPPTAHVELRLFHNMYLFRASLDLTLLFVDQRFSRTSGFDSLLGMSLYALVHPHDIKRVIASHKILLDKGQVITECYRLQTSQTPITYTWVQTHATFLVNSRAQRPQSVILVHYTISDSTAMSCLPKNETSSAPEYRVRPLHSCTAGRFSPYPGAHMSPNRPRDMSERSVIGGTRGTKNQTGLTELHTQVQQSQPHFQQFFGNHRSNFDVYRDFYSTQQTDPYPIIHDYAKAY